MDMARYGGGCWSGYDEVGQSTALFSCHQLFLSGLGQAGKVQAQEPEQGLAQAPAPALFLPDPAHSEPADVMKSMMYFDPPLHILTSIHLHIWPSPYLTYPVIQTG